MDMECDIDIRLKILEDREKRLDLIRSKQQMSSNFFLTCKCNICGNDKNIKETNILLEYFKNVLKASFKVISIEKYESFDGNFYLVEISSKPIFKPVLNETIEENFEESLKERYIIIKNKLIEIENCELGRFIDLDLFNNNEKSISRKDLGLPTRKCILCNDDVNTCYREKRHSLDDVFTATVNTIKSEFIKQLVSITTQSLLEEVSAHPKFGLVTQVNSGKHKDMDYYTFVDSIEVLQPYFVEYGFEGFNLNEDTFQKLREIGVRAEKTLLKKTNGVNTYRGAIFLLGILLPSIVDAVYNNKPFDNIQKNIKILCKDILNDFESLDEKIKNNMPLTYGEKIYIEHGITGIRGVAKSGIKIAFELEPKFSNSKAKINELVIDILLSTMASLDDTVILHKHSIETLNYIKTKSQDIINLGGYSTNVGRKSVEYLTSECIKHDISPGGSADIVTIVLILIKIRNQFY